MQYAKHNLDWCPLISSTNVGCLSVFYALKNENKRHALLFSKLSDRSIVKQAESTQAARVSHEVKAGLGQVPNPVVYVNSVGYRGPSRHCVFKCDQLLPLARSSADQAVDA